MIGRLPLNEKNQNFSLINFKIEAFFEDEIIKLTVPFTTDNSKPLAMKMKHRSQHITRANEDIVIELLNLLNTTLKDFAFGINREDKVERHLFRLLISLYWMTMMIVCTGLSLSLIE